MVLCKLGVFQGIFVIFMGFMVFCPGPAKSILRIPYIYYYLRYEVRFKTK